MGRVVLRAHLEDLRLQAWARNSPERAKRVVRRLLKWAGPEVRRTMQGVARERFNRIGVRAPGMTTSRGALSASIRWTRGTNFVDIGPDVPYAAAVDQGSKPHFIFPRSALALRFRASPVGPRGPVKVTRGNKWVYARRVLHPGFAGHRYVQRTADRFRPVLRVKARQLVDKEMAQGGR